MKQAREIILWYGSRNLHLWCLPTLNLGMQFPGAKAVSKIEETMKNR